MSDTDSAVNDLVAKLEKRKIEGSHATARLTAELLRIVISQQKLPPTNQAAALIQAVRGVGVRLIAANRAELAVGNIVRRVLHVIREEDLHFETRDIEGLALSDDENVADRPYDHVPSACSSRNILRPPSLYAILDNKHNSATVCLGPAGRDFEEKGKSDKNSTSRKLKQHVIEAINMLIEEIDACYDQIAEQAVEHIHQNEVILTFGHSNTVLGFLSAAKEKKRSFRAFITEGAPRYQGHVLAKELVKRGGQTTVITDSAVFATISRVNMVIVGVHAVMANGGAIAPIGLRMVALAAQKHAVPFVIVAGMHKLCPLYPNNPEVFLNQMRSPFELLEYEEFSDCVEFESGNGDRLLHVSNPSFDYVPPELISLFITDIGGHTPSYMYRLVSDYYSADDMVLQHYIH